MRFFMKEFFYGMQMQEGLLVLFLTSQQLRLIKWWSHRSKIRTLNSPVWEQIGVKMQRDSAPLVLFGGLWEKKQAIPEAEENNGWIARWDGGPKVRRWISHRKFYPTISWSIPQKSRSTYDASNKCAFSSVGVDMPAQCWLKTSTSAFAG